MKPEEQVPSQPQAIRPANEPTDAVREQDKIMLVLSYLGVFALIPLLTVKDSDSVKWHAKNGLVLSLGGAIALSILSPLLGAIPMLGCLLVPAAWLAFVVVDVMAITKALKGIRWRIPVVTDLSEKF